MEKFPLTVMFSTTNIQYSYETKLQYRYMKDFMAKSIDTDSQLTLQNQYFN